MNKHFLATMLFAMTALGATADGSNGVLPIYGYELRDYTVTSVSPNGKWAAGYFMNGMGSTYAFRWNLENNEAELLTRNNDQSLAYDVADDGTVVGTCPDYTVAPNGAPITVCGYYKDGSWHTLEPIDGYDVPNAQYDGQAIAISADGHWIGGAIYNSEGMWTPVIWKDGKIYKVLSNEYAGAVNGISDDGTKASGWTYTLKSEGTRVSVMWDVETGESTYLCDEEEGSPFRAGRNFTSDGKYLLHDGGIYNVETGENISIGYYDKSIPWNYSYTYMDDSLRVYGYEQDMQGNSYGTVYFDGTAMKLEDYLNSVGTDVSGLPIAQMIAFNAASSDGKTLSVATSSTEMYEHPLILQLDQNIATRQPAALEVAQVDGMPAAKLMWKAPINNPDNLTGYNVYRGSEKINAEPVTDTYYVDNSLSLGDYSYAVTAVYGDTESVKTDEAGITIAEKPVSAPRSPFARQKGYNSASLTWKAPSTNLIDKKYYDSEADIIGFGGGNNSFEFAIKFNKEEMDVYDGYKISKVSFIPRTAQTSWEVKIYDGSNLIYSQPITQELNYGTENVVVLDTPVEVSSLTDDVTCAIAVTVPTNVENSNVVGMVENTCLPGYSDLVHLSSESEFYSLSEESKAGGYVFNITFALNMILSSEADGEDIDAIKQYNIYSNGELLGSTEDMSYVDKNIADGEYTYEVEAEYADGRISDKVGTTVSIAADKNALPAISDVEVAGTDGTVNFKWNVPMDDDANNISYCSDTYAQTVAGSESSNYGYVARAIYSDDKLKGLGGYNITQLRFYPVNDAIFTFTLRENGNEVAYVEINDYKLGQWNTVTLEQPVTLKENAEYTLDLDCFDGIPEMGPLGCDNLPVMSGYSNLYSVDGGVSFSQVSGSTIGNWMIGMVAVAPDAEPLPVDGYNVRIDGTAVNASPVAETAYTYDFGADADPDAQHRVAIDAIYTGIGEVRGNTVFFTLGDIPATGIGNVITADLRVYPNPAVDYVAVEGADVESITAYTSEGVLAGTCNGNRLDVSSYAPGMYILKIKADGGVKTVRLMVKR